MRTPSEKNPKNVSPIPMESLTLEVIERYVETRKRVDSHIEDIQAITRILALLKAHEDEDEDEENEAVISLHAIGHIGEIMERHASDIWEVLDDFISIAFAKAELEEVHFKLDSR